LRREERFVEEPNQRREGAERRHELPIELGSGRKRRGLFPVANKLLVSKVLRRRMIFAEPARQARQPLALQAAKPLQSRRPHDAVELAMMPRDVLAQHLKLRCVRRVDASADPDPGRGNLEIEAGAVHPSQLAVRKHCRDVRFERLLVLAEPRVAPRAKQRDFGIGADPGREPRQIGGEPLDHGDHGTANVGLVARPIGMKPLASVVPFQRPQE
jgi:hypothetical protein